MTFAFDDQFAMFDTTPVDNQFILEYMPGAKGDYVKVYLYGLVYCYHPKQEMDTERMSRELSMPEEDILAAFRYWERRGIVRRVSDRPPRWQFVNIKQKNIAASDSPEPEYVRFCNELENAFEDIRIFHGSEMAEFYEWKEEMGLTTEVIIMLLKFMARTRGKNFKVKDAEKTAILLSDEKAYTVEDAESILERDEHLIAGFRKVLRKLGKKYNPSDANLMLYRKWTEQWHFTQEAIEAACDQTGTSDPNLALVDSILQQTFHSSGSKGTLGAEELKSAEEQRKKLKDVLKRIGQYSPATLTQKNEYARMSELYPHSIIVLAAQECAAKNRNFDSVVKLLESWYERGFREEKEIREHIAAFHDKEEFIASLRKKWAGRETDIGQKSLQMLEKWENDLGFSRKMIETAADYAFEVRKPFSYMDKLLTEWNKEGIRTPEDAARKREKHLYENAQNDKDPRQKKVAAQQYSQRDYTSEQDEAMQRMISSMNGGENHA